MISNIPLTPMPVEASTPVAANAVSGTYISLKNVNMCWIVITHYSAGGDTDLAMTVNEATAVAATGTTAITATFPIWVNTDTSLSNTLVRQTDAVGYTIDTGAAKNQMVVMQINPDILSDGFDCIVPIGTGGNASNIVSINYWLDMRYTGVDVIAD